MTREQKRDWMRNWRMTDRIRRGEVYNCAVCGKQCLGKLRTCPNLTCRNEYAKRMRQVHTANYNARVKAERKAKQEILL